MRLLVGVYARVLDERGRLCIPARLLAALGDRALYIAVAAHPALALYPEDAVPDSLELIQAPDQSGTQPGTAPFSAGSAVAAPLDGRGRITIPAYLCQHAGLTRQVVLLGAGRHMELWDAQRYELARERVAMAANDADSRTPNA